MALQTATQPMNGCGVVGVWMASASWLIRGPVVAVLEGLWMIFNRESRALEHFFLPANVKMWNEVEEPHLNVIIWSHLDIDILPYFTPHANASPIFDAPAGSPAYPITNVRDVLKKMRATEYVTTYYYWCVCLCMLVCSAEVSSFVHSKHLVNPVWSWSVLNDMPEPVTIKYTLGATHQIKADMTLIVQSLYLLSETSSSCFGSTFDDSQSVPISLWRGV